MMSGLSTNAVNWRNVCDTMKSAFLPRMLSPRLANSDVGESFH